MIIRYTALLLAIVLLFTAASAEASGSKSMSENKAKALLTEYQPETEDSEFYMIYPSYDSYAAWILCGDESPDFDSTYMSGTIWYVDEDGCIKLGSGHKILQFDIFRNTQPEICYCEYTVGSDSRRLQAAYAEPETGTCIKISCGNLIALKENAGVLFGMTRKQNDDYAILDVDTVDNAFIEILPVEVSTEEIEDSRYAGDFDDVCSELMKVWPDLEIDSWYYYSTGVMTLNFVADDCEYHIYVCKSPSGPVLEYDSWEGTPIAYDGFASKKKKTDLEVSRTEYFIRTNAFWE